MICDLGTRRAVDEYLDELDARGRIVALAAAWRRKGCCHDVPGKNHGTERPE